MRVEDERGVEWFLLPASPATPAVNLLKRRHYRWVVLPRYLLARKAEGGILEEDPTRAIRLRECLQELKDAHLG